MTRRPAEGTRILDVLRATPSLAPGTCWLVGVSGGADSVALLRALSRLRRPRCLRLVVAHLNHQLRGRAAAADARFVVALARRLHVPCVVERAEVTALAEAHGWSVEQAAREARLAFFQRLACRLGAQGVVLAHTRDDQAETLLLRLLRGAGGQGLGGMRTVSQVRGLSLLRPLLDVARSELRDYLRSLRQRWREDASNADPRYLRNVIRLQVLPVLERVTGRQVAAPLARTAALLAEEDAYWADLVQAAAGRCGAGPVWRADLLTREPIPLQRRLLVAALWDAGACADFEMVERVRGLLAAPAIQADVGGGLRAVRCGGELRLERAAEADSLPSLALPVGVEIRSAEWGIIALCRRVRTPARPMRGVPGALPARVALDARRVAEVTLAIRAWRAGDRMRPAGGRGSRKLQDLFADAKLPRADRHRIPVLVADDQPIWLPGFRVAEGWGAAGGPALELALRAVEGTSDALPRAGRNR